MQVNLVTTVPGVIVIKSSKTLETTIDISRPMTLAPGTHVVTVPIVIKTKETETPIYVHTTQRVPKNATSVSVATNSYGFLHRC